MKMIMTLKEPAGRAKYEVEVGWDGMVLHFLDRTRIVNGKKHILVVRKWKAG